MTRTEIPHCFTCASLKLLQYKESHNVPCPNCDKEEAWGSLKSHLSDCDKNEYFIHHMCDICERKTKHFEFQTVRAVEPPPCSPDISKPEAHSYRTEQITRPPSNCKSIATSSAHYEHNIVHCTKDDGDRLYQLKRRDNISEEFTPQQPPGRTELSSDKPRSSWTREKDDLLCKKRACNVSWDEIQRILPNCTRQSLYNRMSTLKIVRYGFTEENDKALTQLVEKGLKWSEIAKIMSRNKTFLRERYRYIYRTSPQPWSS